MNDESEIETAAPATPEPLRHNHKSTFGRHVDGCPLCEQRAAESLAGREPEPEPQEAPPGSFTMTFEQLQALMAELQGGQTEALKEFARELRKPDAEAQAAKEVEAARKAEAKRRRIEEIRIGEEATLAAQAQCAAAGHLKENGRSAVNVGQAHNDGFFHPRCYRCWMEFPLIKVTMEAMTS